MAPSQLQIKVSALKRLIKEEGLYRKEAEQHQQSIDKLKADNGDEYEIKKMVSINKPFADFYLIH
jgi:tubulin-specific chaperone A